MSTIYQPILIRPNDERLKAYVESGFDETLLSQLIWDVQELYILPILGTALYDELTLQTRTSALTAANQTLLFTKVQPVLVWMVLANGAHVFTYKFRKQGIVKQNSENSTSADLEEIDRMTKKFDTWAQSYAERLTKFLIENDTTYPLYTDAGSGADTIHPNGSNYRIGWVMNSSGRFGQPPYNQCCNGEENTVDL